MESNASLKFGDDNAFHREVRRRLDDYFQTTGRRRRDGWQVYVKTAVFTAGFTASYVLLVFVAHTWWHGLLFAVLLGLSAVGIGFNVEHDGGHQAYSSSPRVNKLMAMTLELIGGSSYLRYDFADGKAAAGTARDRGTKAPSPPKGRCRPRSHASLDS